MMSTSRSFWILVFFNIFIRLIYVQQPLLEGSATRQAYSAMAAEHFYKEDMNILYPRIHIDGNRPFYQALEIQLLPYMAAVFYKITGGVHDGILRIISILFTVMALYFLYQLILLISKNSNMAWWAALFFGFSPISIYLGRSANFEMAIVAFNLATLTYFFRWINNNRWMDAVLAHICFIFSVSLKVPTLYLLIPLCTLAFQKWQWKFIQKNWFIVFTLLIMGIWQGWQNHLRMAFPHVNWVHFNLAYNIQSILHCFSSQDFYEKIYADALNYALTPFGLVLGILGIFSKSNKGKEKMFYFWGLGVLLFFVAVAEGVWAHGYYHLHYLPIAAYFIAKFIDILTTSHPERASRKIALVILISFVIFSSRYAVPFYKTPENKRYILKAAEMIQQKIPETSLMISSVDSPGTLLYYAHRKGWPMDFSYKGQKGIEILEDLRRKGAQFLVTAYKPELEQNIEFMKFVRSSYPIAYEDEHIIIVNLK